MTKENNICFKYIKVLQTTLAADAHLAEGKFLSEGMKLNIEKSLRYQVWTRRPTASKREGQYFKPQ
jgi:hypothetical protein